VRLDVPYGGVWTIDLLLAVERAGTSFISSQVVFVRPGIWLPSIDSLPSLSLFSLASILLNFSRPCPGIYVVYQFTLRFCFGILNSRIISLSEDVGQADCDGSVLLVGTCVCRPEQLGQRAGCPG
jgi:hypothetical protein